MFSVKVNHDSFVGNFKARLVAKGYTQMYGTDYSDTFLWLLNLLLFDFFFSLANHQPFHQLDINNAFFHGDL